MNWNTLWAGNTGLEETLWLAQIHLHLPGCAHSCDPEPPLPVPAGGAALNWGLTPAVTKISQSRGLMCRHPRAEQAHDSRHECLHGHISYQVCTTAYHALHQPRAGHGTEAAVLAKPMSKRAVTPAKGHYCQCHILRQDWDKKPTLRRKFLMCLWDANQTKALGTLPNEI